MMREECQQVNTHTHTHNYVCIHTHTHTHNYVCIHTHTHTHIRIICRYFHIVSSRSSKFHCKDAEMGTECLHRANIFNSSSVIESTLLRRYKQGTYTLSVCVCMCMYICVLERKAHRAREREREESKNNLMRTMHILRTHTNTHHTHHTPTDSLV